MNGGRGRNKTPWIYRPVQQWSPVTNRIVLVVFLVLAAAMSAFFVAVVIVNWSDAPWGVRSMAFVFAAMCAYVLTGLVMLAVNYEIFD